MSENAMVVMCRWRQHPQRRHLAGVVLSVFSQDVTDTLLLLLLLVVVVLTTMTMMMMMMMAMYSRQKQCIMDW